ncbi:GAF domain-containing protein [Deinococcus altitudinis]|uniref:GAF domain-containing protein n=1 Tax=Deinococcus altitudinis TaxID=468914 RepID=UPI0038914E90
MSEFPAPELLAERIQARLPAFLLKLSDRLRPLTDTAAIEHTALQLLRAHLGVASALYAEALGPDGTLRVMAESLDPGLTPMEGQLLHLANFTPDALSETLAGRPVWRDDVLQEDHTPEQQTQSTAFGKGAWAMVPVVKDGQLVAALVVHAPEARRWTPADITVMQETTERTWAAVERARAEAALRDSEARAWALVSSLPGGAVFILDQELRYQLADGELLTAVGRVPQDYTGKSVFEMMPPELVAEDEPLLRGALAGKAFENERAHGPLTFMSRGVPMRDDAGGVTGVLIVSYDVSRRKRAEAAHREGEQRQAFVLKLSDALRPLTDSAEMERTATRLLGQQLGATRVFYAVVNEGGETWSVQHDYADGVPSCAGQYPMSDFQRKRMAQWQAGRTSSVADSDTDPALSATDRAAYATFDTRAVIGVPLVKGGRFAALLSVNQTEPRAWSETELALAGEVAERTWAAIERARAEEALRASERRYRLLFESMSEGFAFAEMICDEHGQPIDWRYLEVNGAWAQTGVSPEQTVGKTAFEVNPQMEDYWLETYGRVVQTGHPVSFENYAAGFGRWFDTSAFKHSENRFGLLFRDVTTRRATETALREREEEQAYLLKLSDALRPLGDPVEIQGEAVRVLGQHLGSDRAYYVEVDERRAEYVVEHEWHRGGVTSHARRYPLDAWTIPWLANGKPWVVRDVDTDPAMPDDQRASYRGNDIGACVVVPLLKNGRLVATLVANETRPRDWTAAEVALLVETAERTWAAVERVRAEEAVRVSETQFSAVANLVPDLLWASEPDGSTSWYNGRWLEYIGQTLEQATGWGWTDTIHPEDREPSARRYREAVKTGSLLRQEHRIRRHDGEYRWFAVSAYPFKDEAGQVVKMYGAATDIHDLRTLNITLEERVAERTRELEGERAALQVANEELEAFNYSVSHDLMTPVRHIEGFARLAAQHLGEPVRARRDLEIVSQGAQRMNTLIEAMLTLSRTSRRGLNLGQVDLGAVAEQARQDVLPQLEGRAVEWRIGGLPTVHGDRVMLQQALTNLLENAAKYSRGREPAVIEVWGEEDEQGWAVSVRDNGAGFDPAYAGKLFGLFQRLHSQAEFAGTGVGLSLVRRIVTRHGGTVSATGEVGQGATFRFTLPR